VRGSYIGWINPPIVEVEAVSFRITFLNSAATDTDYECSFTFTAKTETPETVQKEITKTLVPSEQQTFWICDVPCDKDESIVFSLSFSKTPDCFASFIVENYYTTKQSFGGTI
jgi:hypothetical protein